MQHRQQIDDLERISDALADILKGKGDDVSLGIIAEAVEHWTAGETMTARRDFAMRMGWLFMNEVRLAKEEQAKKAEPILCCEHAPHDGTTCEDEAEE